MSILVGADLPVLRGDASHADRDPALTLRWDVRARLRAQRFAYPRGSLAAEFPTRSRGSCGDAGLGRRISAWARRPRRYRHRSGAPPLRDSLAGVSRLSNRSVGDIWTLNILGAFWRRFCRSSSSTSRCTRRSTTTSSARRTCWPLRSSISRTSANAVEADGTFTFPLIGRVKAGGMSLRDVEQALRTQLSDGFFKNPQVSVSVEQYHDQRIFVVGEVLLLARIRWWEI